MSKFLLDLRRSCKLKLSRLFFRGGEKRQLQEQVDVHRLFLYTSWHARQQQLGGHVPDDYSAHLIEQAQTLPFEQQRSIVHQQLQQQLVNIAGCIHSCLGEAHDPRPSATALELAWQRMHNNHGISSSLASASAAAGSTAAGSTATAAAGGGGGASGQLLSQHELSSLVQQKLGYSLVVQPSKVAHQEAGLGLFVEGQAAPGSLLALFPGLVYYKPVYRRMPGYPRIDVGNPYLTARYDGRVVDSLPWGTGWQAQPQQQQQQQQVTAAAAAAAAARKLPPRKGLLGRMIAASDGPQRPIPQTNWVHATTAEASYLELLEGRHPLALAHFANHPPAGTPPNAAIASFTFKLGAGGASGSGSSSSDGGAAGGSTSTSGAGDSSSSSSSDSAASSGSSSSIGSGVIHPWVRAYVPNIDYCEECSPDHLLTHEVSCVGLVAVTHLTPGTEVYFNYRLSPAMMGRPAWYVPVDQEEENNRWA